MLAVTMAVSKEKLMGNKKAALLENHKVQMLE